MEDETVGLGFAGVRRKVEMGLIIVFIWLGVRICISGAFAAVQLSRLARVSYPPAKDTTGIEVAAAGLGWLSIVSSLA